MTELFGVPLSAISGQLLLGLINGSFYATLSIGLAIIFGLLQIANFVQGAQYMMGAFIAWMLLHYAGINYWFALIIAPLVVGVLGMGIERVFLSRISDVHHVYGLLLTLGLALIIQGFFRIVFGSSGVSYQIPSALAGGWKIGVMYLPVYRVWVVAASLLACLSVILIVDRTKFGSYLRAATENPSLAEALGINVPLLVSLAYGIGTGLAAFAGVLAAPIYSVNPDMGVELLIIVFAVVIVGGMGSLSGAVLTAFVLGIVEAITKIYYPQGASMVIFIIMILVTAIRPNGIFGRLS